MSYIPNNISPCCFETVESAGSYTKCPKCGYDFSAAPQFPDALPIGTLLEEKYVIGKVLGKGGFGITYLAYNFKIGQKVAIKEYFPSDLSSREANYQCSLRVTTSDSRSIYEKGKIKFLDEARTLAKIGNMHNVVRICDYFETNGTAYIVMDCVSGKTLRQVLSERSGGKMPFSEAFNMLKPAMDALNDVHAEGILHMDISPDNIIITQSGQPVLIDFGATKSAIRINNGQTHVSAYKIGYSPIEMHQSDGKIGPWSDVYSMAATLYRAVTGTIPPDVLDRIGNDTYVSPKSAGADITYEADAAITKALSIDAQSRPQSVQEFVNLLSSENTRPVSSQTDDSDVTRPAPIPQKKSNFPRWLLAAVIVLIIGGIGLYVFGLQANSAKNAMERIASAEDYLNDGKGEDWNLEKILKLISDLEQQKEKLDTYCIKRLGYLEYRVWDGLDSKHIKQHPQIYVDLLNQSANNGYPLAQYNLAYWYNNGNEYVAQDNAQATNLYKGSLPGLEEMARSNTVDNSYKAFACLYAGHLYNDSGWIDANYEKALGYYRMFQDYQKSQNQKIRDGIQKNIAECEVGVAEELCNRGNREDWDKIIELLTMLEKNKKQYLDPSHIQRLAYSQYRMYKRIGEDTQYNDEHKGVNILLLKQSAQNNFPLAVHQLGELYSTGTLVEKNPTKANDLLKRSVAGIEALADDDTTDNILDEADKAYACYTIASHYHNRQFVNDDRFANEGYQKALIFYEKVKAYKNNHSTSDFQDLPIRIYNVKLAIHDENLFIIQCYLNGDKTTWSLDTILSLLESLETAQTNGEFDKKLKDKLSSVQSGLADEIVENDNKKGLELKQKAVENGNPVAMLDLGIWYRYGVYGLDANRQKSDENIASAVNGLKEIANDNFRYKYDRGYAWYGIGEAYRMGLGVEQDRKHALQCYKKAKSMGYDVPQWAIDEVK